MGPGQSDRADSPRGGAASLVPPGTEGGPARAEERLAPSARSVAPEATGGKIDDTPPSNGGSPGKGKKGKGKGRKGRGKW